MIENKVKLVIWDLDDTFWRGTLTEGGVEPVSRNIEIVRELSYRGIINSICSKNDFDQAKDKLNEFGIFDFFVFPSISFNPKGRAISEIIESAALRPQNVLFLDDNIMNLEEVRFFNDGVMACHPDEVVESLLHHPHLQGKPDPKLQRLKQYQLLQRKIEEKFSSTLSNEEFLRASAIEIEVDNNIDSNLERIIDLINRSNQLNYTKIRLETPEAISLFKESLRSFGIHAGSIRAKDKYGDYGIIGFYLLQRRAGIKKLIHFVFSCRTMHMGIEQFVYEMLDRPDIDIVQPVSYGLCTHQHIDWINNADYNDVGGSNAKSRKLVLVGGCDLLQLASYCSSDRVEFVNKISNGIKVRYDDPGFILSDRKAIRNSEKLRTIPLWTYEDVLKFDESLSGCEIVLISMWPAMKGRYFAIQDDLYFHLTPELFKALKAKNAAWFFDIQEISLTTEDRISRIKDSFESIALRCPARGKLFILGCYTKGKIRGAAHELRTAYNNACREYCGLGGDKFQFVDIDAIVSDDQLVDRSHFSREGYFALARHIMDAFHGASGGDVRDLDAA